MEQTARPIDPEQEIQSKALAIPDQAQLIKVVDPATMGQADKMKSVISEMRKEINNFFDPLCEKAHAAHKALTAKRSEVLKPLDEADAYITGQVKNFQRAERDRIEIRQRMLEAEARKKAEEEKLREAEEAEKAGFHEEAQAIIEEPIEVQVPVVKSEAPKVDQRKYRTIWRARVTDKHLFISYIAEMAEQSYTLKHQGRNAEASAYMDYLNALDINQGWLNKKAAALEKSFSMPGVVAYEE